jgi:hypothetical protein
MLVANCTSSPNEGHPNTIFDFETTVVIKSSTKTVGGENLNTEKRTKKKKKKKKS